MKKLLFLLPALFFALAINAQGTQTEDEVYIGKGKTFGNFQGPDLKPLKWLITITGTVIGGGVVSGGQDTLKGSRGGYYSFSMKKDDGSIIMVGTRDYEFTVPKEIVGHKIIVEGMEPGNIINDRKRKTTQKEGQREIQIAATGIRVVE